MLKGRQTVAASAAGIVDTTCLLDIILNKYSWH